MRLRLGIGGRAFGVRGGISTRGFGVGVGPVSVGSSWRGRRGRRRGGGWVGLLPILLVVGWLSSLCGHPQPDQPVTITPTTVTPITTRPTTPTTTPAWRPGNTWCGTYYALSCSPPTTTTLPYSPNGCPADGHPWCSNPTATENPEGDPDTPPTSAPPDWPTTCEQPSAPSWCPNKRTQPGCAGEYCPGNPWEVCGGLQTGRGAPTWCAPYLPQRTGPTPTPTWTPTCAPMDIGCQETVPGVPMVPPGGTLPQGQVI